MFCPNPDCSHARQTGEPAEYRTGLTECQECGSALVETAPEWEFVAYEKFEPVFEIPNPTLVPFVESLLSGAGIRFFIKGVGSGLDFVSGPVRVWVEKDRASEAQELLANEREDTPPGGP
jgi:hypothetical protein